MAVARKIRKPVAHIAVPKAPGVKVTLPQPRLPKPVATKLTTPQIPGGLGQPPAAPAAPAAPGLSPVPTSHDSTYLAGVGKLDFQKSQGISQLQQQQAYDDTDYQEAVRRAAQGHTGDVQTTKEGANRQGLFYSGQLDKRLYGDQGVETLYQRQVADANRDYQRRTAARTAAQQALTDGYPLDVAALAASEADRRVAADLANPPPADQAPAAPAPPGAPTPAALTRAKAPDKPIKVKDLPRPKSAAKDIVKRKPKKK